jgi:hypothetical protein
LAPLTLKFVAPPPNAETTDMDELITVIDEKAKKVRNDIFFIL